MVSQKIWWVAGVGVVALLIVGLFVIPDHVVPISTAASSDGYQATSADVGLHSEAVARVGSPSSKRVELSDKDLQTELKIHLIRSEVSTDDFRIPAHVAARAILSNATGTYESINLDFLNGTATLPGHPPADTLSLMLTAPQGIYAVDSTCALQKGAAEIRVAVADVKTIRVRAASSEALIEAVMLAAPSRGVPGTAPLWPLPVPESVRIVATPSGILPLNSLDGLGPDSLISSEQMAWRPIGGGLLENGGTLYLAAGGTVVLGCIDLLGDVSVAFRANEVAPWTAASYSLVFPSTRASEVRVISGMAYGSYEVIAVLRDASGEEVLIPAQRFHLDSSAPVRIDLARSHGSTMRNLHLISQDPAGYHDVAAIYIQACDELALPEWKVGKNLRLADGDGLLMDGYVMFRDVPIPEGKYLISIRALGLSAYCSVGGSQSGDDLWLDLPPIVQPHVTFVDSRSQAPILPVSVQVEAWVDGLHETLPLARFPPTPQTSVAQLSLPLGDRFSLHLTLGDGTSRLVENYVPPSKSAGVWMVPVPMPADEVVVELLSHHGRQAIESYCWLSMFSVSADGAAFVSIPAVQIDAISGFSSATTVNRWGRLQPAPSWSARAKLFIPSDTRVLRVESLRQSEPPLFIDRSSWEQGELSIFVGDVSRATSAYTQFISLSNADAGD